MMWLFIVGFGAIGLFVGSLFATTVFRVVDHLPVKGRPSCRTCLAPVATADLIPVVSYLRLRGRCRNCTSVIEWQYPAIELAMGIVFAVLAARTVLVPSLWFDVEQVKLGALLIRDLVAAATFVILFAYDVRQYVVPDKISLPAILVIILMNIVLGIPAVAWIMGGLIGALFFGIQYAVSGGHLVGSGDIRAGALVGVVLGFPGVLESIAGAYVLACIVAIPLFLSKKISSNDKAPFVAFLAVSTIVLLCTGPILNSVFFQFFG